MYYLKYIWLLSDVLSGALSYYYVVITYALSDVFA